MNTPEPRPAAEKSIPMRTLSVITGVNPVTLRAWERRYGLIKPARTRLELGERWANKEGSIAEEHFFGAFMRNKLGARFHHRHKSKTDKRIEKANQYL